MAIVGQHRQIDVHHFAIKEVMQRSPTGPKAARYPLLGPAAGHATQRTARSSVPVEVPRPACVVHLFQPQDQPVVAGLVDGPQFRHADPFRHVAVEATLVDAWLVQPVELFEHAGVVLGRNELEER